MIYGELIEEEVAVAIEEEELRAVEQETTRVIETEVTNAAEEAFIEQMMDVGSMLDD